MDVDLETLEQMMQEENQKKASSKGSLPSDCFSDQKSHQSYSSSHRSGRRGDYRSKKLYSPDRRDERDYGRSRRGDRSPRNPEREDRQRSSDRHHRKGSKSPRRDIYHSSSRDKSRDGYRRRSHDRRDDHYRSRRDDRSARDPRPNSNARDNSREPHRKEPSNSRSQPRRHESRELTEEERKAKQDAEAQKLIDIAKQQKEESEREDSTVLVTRLHLRADEKEVYKFFKENNCGRVRDIRLIRDPRSHKSKGVAYVEFFTPESVIMAMQCSGKQLMGQTLSIQASMAEKNRAALASKFKKQQIDQKDNQKDHAEKKEKGCKICIQGLIDDKQQVRQITEDDVKKYFEGYGVIDSIEIPRDHITQKAKGYILVDFSRAYEARDACKMLDGFKIEGNRISVQVYNDYLQKQLNQQENKKSGEEVLQENNQSYIRTQQARTMLMQKLMQSKAPDQSDAEKQRQLDSLGIDSFNNDEGQAIRSQNSKNGSYPPPPVVKRDTLADDRSHQPTACVILTNMFEASKVDLDKEPEFFIDIKDHVYNVCRDWGRVEKILIDEDSSGHVWIKYGGSNCQEAAYQTIKTLNQKTFDERIIGACYGLESVFHRKLSEK